MIGARRRIGGATGMDNSWPGFVDALSTLLLVIIFLLSMFVLAQFFLGQALTGREQALVVLRGQVSELGNLLKMEQQANVSLRDSMTELSVSLTTANADRDRLTAELETTKSALEGSSSRLDELSKTYAELEAEASELRTKSTVSTAALSEEQVISARARSEVARLQSSISALREQLTRLDAALDNSEERDRRNQAVIVDLGRRLNRALASKVEELVGYRSEFFGRLKEVLSTRPEIRIEGDRFVFASELLFASASADLGPEGRTELRKFAETLMEIASEIPAEVNWILRIDGHTDNRPISNFQFRNNWELSAARAISVVQFLISEGVPADRLAAAGFGEHQPLDPGEDAFALSRNRRIEMRLTQR